MTRAGHNMQIETWKYAHKICKEMAKYALKLQKYAKLKTVLNAFFIENPDINTIANANNFGSERKKRQIFSKKCPICGFSQKSAKPAKKDAPAEKSARFSKKCQTHKKMLDAKRKCQTSGICTKSAKLATLCHKTSLRSLTGCPNCL